jgi:uncharacterized protein (TIGR03435 family)
MSLWQMDPSVPQSRQSLLVLLIVITALVGLGALVDARGGQGTERVAQPSSPGGSSFIRFAPETTSSQQAAGTTVKFDVASFRRNREDEEQRAAALRRNPDAPLPPGRAQTRPGGVFQGRAMTVRELVRDAYGYRNRAASEVTGGPAWIDTERYDVLAKGDADLPASTNIGLPPAAESALRVLLNERLRLRVHVESRQQRVYELLMSRDDRRPGPQLVASKGGCRSFYARETQVAGQAPPQPTNGSAPAPIRGCQWNISSGGVLFEGMTMDEWARYLASFPQIDATVLNRTGLTGVFDIKLEFSGPTTPGLPPQLEPFLEQQLGLRLRRTEGPVDVLVIDSVERPSEN